MNPVAFLLLLCLAAAPLRGARAQEADSAKIVPDSRAAIQMSFAPVVKKVAPAVVNIYTKRVVTQRISPFMDDPFFRQFFGNAFRLNMGGVTRDRVENALGSGVIVSADGLVVTNAHVIKGADEIQVVLPDGREFDAHLTLTDAPSDLALLRISAPGEKLPYVTLKPSENMQVGDLVLAIGNPFGVGQTVTSGIISALARSSLNIENFNFFIQTDAAINPGNSGGPLVAMDGSVIGINTAIFSQSGGSLGIGFAIPSEMVATVVAAEGNGQAGDRGVVRAWLGVTTQAVTPEIAESLGFKRPHGVLIASLHHESPARKAGMQVGDVVVALDGREMHNSEEMKFRMATVPLGATARFDILRKGKPMTIEVVASAPPDAPPRRKTVLSGRSPLSGATVANINPAVAVELGLREEEGVVILSVAPQTEAARLAAPGDIVSAVNDKVIADVGDLQEALRLGQATGWKLLITHNGQKRQIVIR
jgi:serine protease Do